VTFTQRTAHATLAIVRLGRTEWRISEASDGGRLLGFIERQRRDRFEVLWMSEPNRWGYTDTFDSAVAAFADPDAFAGEVLPERARSLR
jgi:hypothetical protein